MLHSPAQRPVVKDITVKEQRPTGLENMAVSDKRKAPQTITLGKQEREEVMELTLLCDVWCLIVTL